MALDVGAVSPVLASATPHTPRWLADGGPPRPDENREGKDLLEFLRFFRRSTMKEGPENILQRLENGM